MIHIILVYVNSKELAIKYAAALGGIYIQQKDHNGKVKLRDLDKKRDLVETQITDGFLYTTYGNDTFYFVFSDGHILIPKKLSEYDERYKVMANRPVPFLPPALEYKCVDENSRFFRSLDIYTKLYKQADCIINAATDDIDGEVDFEHFIESLTRYNFDAYGEESLPDVDRCRIRPHAISEEAVANAMHSKELLFVNYKKFDRSKGFVESDITKQRDKEINSNSLSTASKLQEEMAWLFSCNITNAMTQNCFEKKVLISGMWESWILSDIVSGERIAKHMERHPLYRIVLTLKADNSESERPIILNAEVENTECSEKTVNSLLPQFAVGDKVTVKQATFLREENLYPAFNAFTLQIKALEHGIRMDETIEAMRWLHINGYITWPTDASEITRNHISLIATAVTTLSKDEQYDVRPRDMENILAWSEDNRFGRVGILLTNKLLTESEAQKAVYYRIYQLIEENIAKIVGVNVVQETESCQFEHDKGYVISAINTKKYEVPAPSLTLGQIQRKMTIGETYTIEKVERRPVAVGENHTMLSLLKQCYAAYTVTGKGLINKHDFFSSAISNLFAWKEIEMSADGHIQSTPYGRLVFKYLDEQNIKFIINWVILWNRFLGQYSEYPKVVNPRQRIVEPSSAWISDLCSYIEKHGSKIKEANGASKYDFRCPVCDEPIIYDEKKGVWHCSKCDYEFPNSIFGHVLTENDVMELVTKRKTSIIKDFVGNTNVGKNYQARLVLEPDKDGIPKVARTFKYELPCPYCGGEMNEFAWGVKCKNVECGFIFNKEILSHTFTEQELACLLQRQKTGLIEMRTRATENNPSRRFKAMLYLDDEKKLKFEYPQKKSKKDIDPRHD